MADTTSALTVQNGFSTTLSTAVSSTDTIFYLATLPTGSQGFLTIDEGLSTAEIIFFTSKGSNFVQCTSIAQGRGQDGTSAVGHSSGAVVKMKTNAGFWKALQDGSGLSLTSLPAGTLPTNNVTAANLATSAITLGYAQITSNFSTTNTTATQVTSLTTTVTIPAGGRRIKITAFGRALYNSASGAASELSIWDGTVGSGTQLCLVHGFQGGGSGATQGVAIACVTPSAGSKTYNVGLHSQAAGTATLEAGATYPAFILVEAI